MTLTTSAPAKATFVQGTTGNALSGFSLAETGNVAGETFTATVSDNYGLLAASGTSVTGSGTTRLTITGTLDQVNAALATLTDNANQPQTSDYLQVSAHDSFGNAASSATNITVTPLIVTLTAPAKATFVQGTTGNALSGFSLAETGNVAGETFTATVSDNYGLLAASGTGVTGSGTTRLTITGTLDQVNAALATLTDSTNQPQTSDYLQVSARDSFGNTAASATNVTVTPLIVTLTAPAKATFVQGTTGNALSGFSLAETGNVAGETFTATVSDNYGLLAASGTGVTGSGTTRLTITGTLDQVNAALATLTDNANQPQISDYLQVSARDSFGNAASSATNITVTPLIVTLTAPAKATFVQGTTGNALSGFSLAETGNVAGETFTATVSDNYGLLAASGTSVTGSGTTRLTITGTLDQVNAALATLTDNANQPQISDYLQVSARDSFGNAASSATNITVTPLIVTLTAPAKATFVQGTTGNALSGFSLAETGNVAGETFTATVSDNYGLLAASGTGVTGSGTTRLTITGTLDQVNAALATLTDNANQPQISDYLQVSAHDSFGNAASSATNITVTPVIGSAPSSVVVGTGVASPIPGVSISEPGSAAGATFTTKLTDAAGLLSVRASATPGASVTGAGTTSLTVAGTLAQVNAVLATLVDTLAGKPTDTIALNATDSQGNAAITRTIAVTANGIPVLSGVPASLTLHQGQPGTVPVTLTETGTTSGETFTVSVSAKAGILAASGTGVSGTGTGLLTVTGSLALVQSDLATLTATESAAAPDTITFNAVDGFGNSAASVVTSVLVTPVLPLALVVPQAVSVHAGRVDPLAGFSLAEPGAIAGETYTVAVSDRMGLLQAGSTGSGATSLTFTGTLAQVNAALATLAVSEPAPGTDALTLTASDSYGNTAPSQAVGVSVLSAPVTAAPATLTVEAGHAAALAGVSVREDGAAAGLTFTVALSDAAGLLFATGSGVTGSGTTTLSLSGTPDQVDADLLTLSIGEAQPGSDTVTVTATDSQGQQSATRTIGVTVNGPIMLSAPTRLVPVPGTAAPIPGLGVAESGNTSGETFALTLSAATGQLSAVAGTGGATVTGAGTTALTLQGTIGQVNQALSTVNYLGTGAGADTINVQAADSLGGSAAASLPAAPGPALVVEAITAPSQGFAGQVIPIDWTDRNSGSAAATGPWVDEVFLATDATGAGATLIGSYAFTGTLASGAAAARTVSVTLPAGLTGQSWVVVEADADGGAPEAANAPSRTLVDPAPITVTQPLQAALVVSSITPPSAGLSGQATQVSWVVTNTGAGATSSTYWVDKVYLSLDRTLDTSDLLVATVPNPAYLAPGESYASQATFTLPQGIAGPYYVIVYTDVGGQGAHGGSAVITSQVSVSTPFPVALSPSPDLQVPKIVTPAQDFSGQKVALTWTVTNTGSVDAHSTSFAYLDVTIPDIGPPPELPNYPGETSVRLQVAVSGGGGGVAPEVLEYKIPTWADSIYLSTDGVLDSQSVLLGTTQHLGNLAAGASYTASATVTLPVGVSGSATIFVVPDVGSDVYEAGGPALHSGGAPVQINLTPPPDLEVTVGAIPSGVVTGHTLAVSYTVANAGSTATPNTYWIDAVYLSPTPTLGSDAVLLGTVGHTGALDVGQSYRVAQSFTLSDSLSGTYYVIAQTDSTDVVFEVDRANDVAASAAPVAIDFASVNLIVSSVAVAAKVTAGHQATVTWQVTNTGDGDTGAVSWQDRVVLSASGLLGAADNLVLTTQSNPGSLAAGGSYTTTATVALPANLAGAYSLFVVTNATGSLSETSATDDASAPQSLTVAPLPALHVSGVTGPSSDQAGDQVNVSWTVTDASAAAAGAPSWQDSVFLSTAASGSSGSILLGSLQHTGGLTAGASYTATASFTLPSALASGTYYFVVAADAQQQLLQAPGATGTAVSAGDAVTQIAGGGTVTVLGGAPTVTLPSTDIATSAVISPTAAVSGQLLTLGWTDTNNATAQTAAFADEVYLSRDQVLDTGTAIALGSLLHSTGLAADATRAFTASFAVPTGLAGAYYAFVVADAGAALNDPDRSNNEAISSLVQVLLPAPVDLALDSVTFLPPVGTTVTVGGIPYPAASTLSVTYTVKNLADALSIGSWEDDVYLSTDGVWHITDPLLGKVQHTGGIAANGTYTATLTAVLPGLATGSYYAIVKTNVLNNQPETSRGNNTGVSATATPVSLPTLSLGVPTTGRLPNTGAAYYQFTVSAGQTVDVSLHDSGNGADNVFIGYNRVPTIGSFDAAATDPLTPDPDAVIRDTEAGTYYVLVQGGAGDAYSLTASTIGFSVTGITPNAGSNAGSVTLTIDGAKFGAADQVEIVAPGGGVLQASHVAWVDSGEIWATFNLAGAATGRYDVVLLDGAQSATLPGAFTVTDGAPGRLAVNLVAPSALHTHNSPDGLSGTENGIVTIQYANTGGTDIPAPVLDLTAATAHFNVGVTGLLSPTEVAVLGTSSTGPAGILQPGAIETVSYTFAGNFGYAQFVNITLTLGTLQGSDASTIDWSSLEDGARPAWIDIADWHLVWTRFEAQVGGTTGSLVTALSQVANTLSQIGQPANDVGTLLAYEVEAATGTLPDIMLAQATDLAGIGPGLDLGLGRSYDSSLTGRDAQGAFGDGWTFTYGTVAVTGSDGMVFVTSPGGLETFTLNADGSYTAAAGDADTLALANGRYVLTAPDGSRETFRPDGKLDTLADANGNAATVQYDANGTITGVTGTDGQSFAFTTNAAGEITQATDAAGNTVRYGYDATSQHLTSVTTAAGTTTYSYEGGVNPLSQNALAGVSSASGSQTFGYDALGGLASETTGESGTVTLTADGPGKVVETDATGSATTLIYRSDDNLAEAQDAAGHVVRFSYDAAGDLTGATAADGSSYSFRYDALGNLTGYTDAQGGIVAATYAPGTGELTSFTDADGNTTHYLYDSTGNFTALSYADGSGTTYRYDAQGTLTASTDARGITTAYSYDGVGRLTGEAFSDGTSQAYGYDAKGELVSATATDGGVTHYAYDARGDLTSVTDAQGRVESYGYDAAGREVQRLEPDGTVTNYGYDAAGQLAGLTDGSGALLVRYGYDAAGRVAAAVAGNGATTTYAYDTVGDTTEIKTTAADGLVTSRLDYSYDADGRPVTEASLDGTWSYSYDANGELIHAVFASTNPSVANQDLTYQYDAAGNRTQTIFNGAVSDYTTNGLNQYTAVDGTTNAYDAAGNLVSRTSGGQTTTYGYDAQGRLVTVGAPGQALAYAYDALGDLVSASDNGVHTDYVVDPLAINDDATGTLAAVAQAYGAGSPVTYEYGLGLVATAGAGGVQYVNFDAAGNAVDLSGPKGVLTASTLYDPFGNVLATSGAAASAMGFTAEFGDVTVADGLVSMRARSYDPALGRFTSADPSGFAGGPNLYEYAGNAPTYAIDPIGLDTFYIGGGLSRYFGGGVGISGGVYITTSNRGGSFDFGYYRTVSAGVGYDIGFSGGLGRARGDISNFRGPGKELAVSADIFNLTATSSNGKYTGGMVAFGLKSLGGHIALTDTYAKGFFETVMDKVKAYEPQSEVATKRVKSVDPNDIVGPTAYGPQDFVGTAAPLAYTIDFENAATATAPAQSITVTQQLDPSLDWRTFRLTGFGFDNLSTTLSGKQAFYSGLLDYSATKGYDVQVTAGVNVVTGLVTWTFQTIDPATGQAPVDPQLGLLPVDDDTQDGEGAVSYTIQARSSAQTGDIVSAQATIIFDTNAPIASPTIADTIDGTAPASAVDPLPAHTDDASFDVSWTGTDDLAGSGIADYTVLVSVDGTAVTTWLADTTRTNAIYQGALGHSYAFSTIATDNAGNTETPHATPDATIITGDGPVPCFLKGTRIATPAGEIEVEALSVGDLVLTASGEVKPIVWIGRRSYARRFVRGNRTILPVRIARGALDGTLPIRDLWLSPLHALMIDGLLIPAGELVNKTTINQVCDLPEIHYFHIELDQHDVLIAEGAPAESFLDDGSMGLFQNAAERPKREYASEAQGYCAPRVTDGYALEDVRRRIARVAGSCSMRTFSHAMGS